MGVKVTWQLAVAPFPVGVQLAWENAPGPLLEKATAPVGVIGVPGLVSVTVTVHVVGVLCLYGLEHDRETETPRFAMVSPPPVELDA